MKVRHIEFPTPDPAYPQYIAVLEDVYVSPHGLIFDADFELIPEVNFNGEFWPAYVPINGVRDIGTIARNELAGDIVELPSGCPYVYAVHYFGRYVFGHLWDSLQPLIKVERRSPGNCTLLVNRTTADVNELSRHFELVGYDRSRRWEVTALTRVPLLWYPSVACYPGRVTVEGRDWLREKYLAATIGAAGDLTQPATNLYLSRNDPDGGIQRRVTNNEQVVSQLEGHGFRVVNGSESLDEHIRLFRSARRITGPHGSMFRNVLFSDAGCRVLEFCSARRLDFSLLEVGKVCGVDYELLEVPGDENNNIFIDPEILDRWLCSIPMENARR